MAAPVGENYLATCKEFLKEFTDTINPNDPLPVKVTGYNIEDVDLEGEIIDWTLQYLNQKSCPHTLGITIAHSVLNEMKIVVKEDRELRVYIEDEKEVQYDPMKLMHTVIAKVNAVCERFLRATEIWDEKDGPCPQLPPPAPGPPFVSTFAIKNHRRRMEDRHVAIDDLHSLFNVNSPGQVGYYAIFDGHHGHEAAAYSAAQLHGLVAHSEHYPKDPEAALRDALLRADEIFIKKCATSQKLLSGTTALVALLRHRESLHVAWLGDSLGILVRSGGKVIQLVEPHTADRIDERRRIEAAGGVVIMHFSTWRINGTLAISRAIGDPDFKPHVTAAADLVTHQLDGSEHFLILACDGLWDCVTSEEAAAFVYDQLRQDPDNYSEIGKALVQLAKSRASNDNISVVVVLLSTIKDILATAPPPVTEQPEALFASDGLVSLGTSAHLMNGTMDGETAQFESIQKVPSPEGAIDLATRNGLTDIMMSSFYGNGTEDGRDLFANQCDLGPETDVDLLDDDIGGRAEQMQTEEAWCGLMKERVVSHEELLERVEKEDLEVVGGVDEEDDSEDEDAEWKYVSVKSVGIVPVSPEPSLEDKPAPTQALSEHEIEDLLEQSVEAVQQVAPGTEDSGETVAPTQFSEKQAADENKICSELDSEVVLKVDLEENPNLNSDTSIQGLQNQVPVESTHLVGGFKQELGEELEESLEDSAMESRLNPDAAEFVPISPTRSTVPEPLPTIGNEFDVFRKEAEACPGEIFDEMSSIPATSAENEVGPTFNNEPLKMPFDKSDLVDADVVLSSSFKSEQLIVEKVDSVVSTEEYVVEDSYNFVEENKENIPVCDDKENILLPTNPEFVMTEDVLLTSLDREIDRIEENMSDTTATPDLQVTEDSSASEVLRENVESDQITQEVEIKIIEATESANLLTEVHEERSHELPQSVEQDHDLSSHLLAEQEERLEYSDDKVHSPEHIEPVQKSTTEMLDPFEMHQSLDQITSHGFEMAAVETGKGHAEASTNDFEQDVVQAFRNHEEVVTHDFEAFACEVDQSHEKMVTHGFEQDMVEADQSHEKMVTHGFEQDVVEADQSHEMVVTHGSEQDAVEADESQEKLATLDFEDACKVDEIHEKVATNDFELVSMEVDQSHEEAATHGLEQDAFQIDEIHQIVASEDFKQENVSSTQGQNSVDELHAEFDEQSHEPENVFEKEIHIVESELMSEVDKKLSNLSVQDDHHVVEQFHEHLAEVPHTERPEISSPIHEVNEKIQISQSEDVYDDVVQTLLKEEKQPNYHNEGEQYLIEMGKELHVKSTEDINTESLIESSIENSNIEIECTSAVPGSVFHTELEVKSPTEKFFSPSPVPEATPIPEICQDSLVPKSPTPGLEVSLDTILPIVVAEQTTLSVQDDIPKSNQVELFEHEAVLRAVTPDSINITPVVDLTAVEPLIEVKEVVQAKCEPIAAGSTSLEQSPSEVVLETMEEVPVVEEKVNKVTTEPPRTVEITPSLPLDAKSPAKKTLTEKKKVPEKGKVTAMAAAKGKVPAKSSMPPARISLATAKMSATSPTKPLGTLASRPIPAERKTAAPAAGKPAASSRSTSAPLSSKPRTSTLKPSPVPATRSAPPTKPSTTASRPGTAGTASLKLGSASTASKPASTIAKSSVTQSKASEVKRAVNGDASKPTAQNSSVPAKAAPRKLPLTSTTSVSKPSASLTKTSRPSSATQKAASEVPKPKPLNAVNGTTSKPTRTVSATATKSAAPLSAQTKKPLTKTATSTVGDPKKAKESANKHISASRSPIGASGARRGIDIKGSVTSKTASTKGHLSGPKAALSNGTVTKKVVDNSDSIKDVKGKMDLVIKENGVAVEGHEVTKEEESAVLCVEKEQVMLIVEEGVRETM